MAIMDRVRRGQFDLSGLPADLRQVVAAALDPEPRHRPTFDQLLAWLRPLTTQRGQRPTAPPAAVAHDPYTVPLALASQAAADDETDVWPGHNAAEPHTLALTSYGDATALRAGAQGLRRRAVPPRDRCWSRPPLAAGAGCAAYPWVTTGLLLVVVWLLRSGSLAASAHDQRRQYRGRKWYDGAQLLIAAPWHLVQSIPGTVLLALWSLGLAAAAALVCYAIATGVSLALFVCGVVLTGSLWFGPGGSRVRGPVAPGRQPARRRPEAVGDRARSSCSSSAAVLGFRADLSGASWTPGSGPSVGRDRSPRRGPRRGSMGRRCHPARSSFASASSPARRATSRTPRGFFVP